MIKLLPILGLSLLLLSGCVGESTQPNTEDGADTRLLFIGNSHTGNGDVPGTIKAMMESDGSGRKVYVEQIGCAFLEDVALNKTSMDRIEKGKWDAVICQGVKLSSSHMRSYPHEGAVEVVKSALKGGAKAYLYAEWPRKDWDETDYILRVYGQVAKDSGGHIIPTCRAWDLVLQKDKNPDLWFDDGNHSSPLGAYLACSVIYYWLSGDGHTPSYVPKDVTGDSKAMRAVALETYKKFYKDTVPKGSEVAK